MGRKVEINYSKVKEISELGLSIKETLERLHECNINISRMQYYRWKQNNVTSSNNVTSNTNTKLSKKENYVTKNNVTSKHSSNTKYNVTSSNNNVTSKGRYEVVGLGLENRTELKGKRFDTVDEITSIGVEEIFIYDYELGRCLSREYVTKTKPFLPFAWR